MADLGEELLILGGGGKLGSALQLSRYWPAATCGLMAVPAVTGSLPAIGVLLLGAVGVGLSLSAEKRMKALP